MTRNERMEFILKTLEETRSVEIAKLAGILGASSVTVRSDLKALEKAGKLRRTRGGAVIANEAPGDLRSIASVMKPMRIPDLEYKEALARAVVKLIAPGDSVFLGGGSTFYVIARHLKARKDIRIVTSNLNIAFELAPHIDNIFFIGGELTEYDGLYNTGGPKVAGELEKIYVNKAFVGVSGIDINAQLTVYDLSQFTLLTSTKKIARESILVADASKFGFQSAHRIGSVLDVADAIMTNREIDPRYTKAFHAMNIPTMLA